MKILCLLAALLLPTLAGAQFYAPPVDFHDVAQRRFVVEAARVLAFQRNGAGEIAEVTYQVETAGEEQVAWTVQWRGPAGAVLHEAKVQYPPSALLEGPGWYRSVWRQLVAGGWFAPSGAADPELAASFWQGAQSAGLSRMEGVQAALPLIAPGAVKTAAQASQLAGTLVQASLPMVAGRVTLDGALLARSAAWLCVAEQMSSTQLAPEWGPLLAMAGRGPEAKKAWTDAREPAGQVAPVWHCWDLLVRLPPAREAFAVIASPANRLYAGPLLDAYSAIDGGYYYRLLYAVIRDLYPGDRLTRLYDYGPTLNHAAVGQALNEHFPAIALQACLDQLGTLKPGAGDAQEVPALARAIRDFAEPQGAIVAPSLALVDLLNQAASPESHPLIPVGVVTAHDLLLFAYESSGLQFAALHQNYRYTSTRQADELDRMWFLPFPTWSVFMDGQGGTFPNMELDRFEFIRSRAVARNLFEHPPQAWPATPDAYLRRRWLADDPRGLEYLLLHDGSEEQATQLVRRVIQEGNQRAIGPLLWRANYIADEVSRSREIHFDLVLDRLGLREELIKAAPLNIGGAYSSLREKLATLENPWKQARALEQFHWECGVAIAPQTVFHQYVKANALVSARRFYERWHGPVWKQSELATGLGAGDFALAVLEGDGPRARATLQDVKPTENRTIEITAALLADDVPGARREIKAILEDAPWPNFVPDYRALDGYLDSLPLLLDARLGEHERMVRSFPKPWFLLPQWVLFTKARLTPEEAVTFFDDGQEQGPRRLIALALQGDKAGFEELYGGRSSANGDDRSLEGSTAVLLAWLRNHLLAIPAPKDEPDLRPLNAEPLLPMIKRIAAEPIAAPK